MLGERISIPGKLLLMVALLLVNATYSQIVRAQVPLMINYQGKIEMTGVPFNGPGYFKFSLVDNTTRLEPGEDDHDIRASRSKQCLLLLIVDG